MIIEEIFIPKINKTVKFYVGKNKLENFTIIDNAQENDLWFHIDDHASCHVVASINDFNLPNKKLLPIIKQGALLCKKNSKYKSVQNIGIVYAKIKNVIKTDIIGTVNLLESKTIEM